MIPFVNIHTHKHIDNNESVEIINIDVDDVVNVDVSLFYSLGIHPWDAETRKLEESCFQNFKAIGECGLDRACDSDFEIQKSLFLKQIEMSEKYMKPMIIHAVRTYPDIIAIRKATKARQAWIIHGFQGNEQSAKQLLRHDGIFLSLGEVLFKNESKARRLLQVIPLERMFFETDIAVMRIASVYEKASLLSGMEIDILRNGIFNNYVKIFG